MTVHIDTNVFVRFFIHDIELQFQEARKLFEQIEQNKNVGMVSLLVVNEFIWIMENYYEIPRNTFLPEFIKLLSQKGIRIIEVKKKELFSVFDIMVTEKIDFTDAYLYTMSKGETIVTFDKKLQKLSQ